MAKKTYEVVGTQPVALGGKDRLPGEIFRAEAPDNEAFLVSIGAIRVTNAAPAPADEAPAPADQAPAEKKKG
jgi:hypothetical protein